jgi:hypothetical protein
MTSKARAIIDSWDFSPIVERAVKNGLPAERSAAALAQFREFLFQVAANPGLGLSPQSAACDDLWHEFIVTDTRAYFRFCDAVFGHYLHHTAMTSGGKDNAKISQARSNTAKLFGITDPAMCGEVAECGDIAMCGEVSTVAGAPASL